MKYFKTKSYPYYSRFVIILGLFWFLTKIPLSFGEELISKSDTTSLDKAHFQELIQEFKKVNTATQHARNAVNSFPDSVLLPELLFQLAEWEVRFEKLQFEIDMFKYDLKLKLFEEGKIKTEPDEPLLTYQNTLGVNRKIQEMFPNVPFINKVNYRTAICLFETGVIDSAKQLFLKLLDNPPDSSYKAEIIFRVGECYFDEESYAQALKTYQQILETWDSPFFAMALYKIAWCHYQMNNLSDAISTFYYLLSDIKLLENLDSEILGKSQVQLKNEAIDYIAISFTDYGGKAALLDFIRKSGEHEHTPDILYSMANVYFKRDFFEESTAIIDMLFKGYQTYAKLPEAFTILYNCYDELGNFEVTQTMHDRLIAQCGPKSKWYTKNNSREDIDRFMVVLKDIDFKIATPLINSADSLFAIKDYENASKSYLKFMKSFRKDDRVDRAQYCLAECYYNLGDYSKSALAYKSVVLGNTESNLREDAAYNYVYCYDRLLSESAIDIDDENTSITKTKEIKEFVQACQQFLKWVPKSNKTSEIQLKLAELFYRKQSYELGEKLAKASLIQILKSDSLTNLKSSAINLLAQINFKQEKFKASEKWFSMLIEENPDSTELIEKSKKMLASSAFKIGEELKSGGNIQQAALKFEMASKEATDPQIAEAALFEAAIQFEKAEQYRRACLNFEHFFKKYPESEHAQESIYRAALMREKQEQWYLAARNYISLFEKTPTTQEGASALFNAGLNYEKAKDWFSAAETYNKFIATFPNDAERILEALFKTAYAYEQKNVPFKAQIGYQNLLKKYEELLSAGEFADDFFAAQATFRLGELQHDKFTGIKLTPPFQVNMQKKQLAFNEMLKVYVNVTKYDIAEWTTAAFFRLGSAYEEFCQDILNSPAPKDLSEADLDTYWAAINQQWVAPLQQEALKYYETNTKLATENNVTNEWTKKTQDRIIFINQKLAQGNVISQNTQVKDVVGTTHPPARKAKHNL